ncbi:MAG: UDP-N-acetylglucosamine--N-acetylmuramyl-(pentapeptide) pyrophosphoryl-undecaprenol N-acetylglucosamine transferase [Synergistaceae bacterium]|jgi:UDP-N-acetylglucosamine--N-acetylmuramyl-(pentapeptide) pyrophosphoryl-undecaprenol N-acetylglucosamine transferase|nr:UDP-N-acetylglucosamine--N-acetylmuramyl-(pentapeptide) pyrophosphoryl-undecaprenol N-acetylglucosamine transferase [Synergistaceae bacterium]
MSAPRRILLVAGGTGGHILPAAAFGDWIIRNHPGVEVYYMSGRRPIELEIYRSLKIEPRLVPLDGSPIGAPAGKKLSRWFSLFSACLEASVIFKRERPELCVLFGGYVSAVALFISLIKRIPMVAHEQNASAGRTTKLARRVGVSVASGWEICAPLPEGSFRRVGVPVRPLEGMDKKTALDRLGLPHLSEGDVTVGVMTGSLGSDRLLEVIGRISGLEEFASWNFLAISGSVDSPRDISRNLFHLPKMWDIAPLFNASDILVTRGGASTLSEVEASGIEAVVVPWRKAASDHQMKNAMAVEKSGKIEIWDEGKDESDLALKLRNLCGSSPTARRDIGKKMYNASGNISGRLWNFCCGLQKGRD